VIDEIESRLVSQGVFIRRADIFGLMYPSRRDEMLRQVNGDLAELEAQLTADYSLFLLFEKLGKYQDIINRSTVSPPEPVPFSTYDRNLNLSHEQYLRRYEELKSEIAQRTFFHNVVFPMVFHALLAAILEYQADREDLELLSS
jgi:hypothetical protein